MYNTNIPQRGELPGSAQLIRSTVVALLVALALLVTAVLPAEYGIDPTGVGRLLGLTQMGQVKMSAQANASPASGSMAQGPATLPTAPLSSPLPPSASAAPSIQSDLTSVSLMPGEGAEVKLGMEKGGTVKYRWTATGGKVNFDAHGEASTANISVSYKKGKDSQTDDGVLEAAFLGQHGWYWKNRGNTTVTIKLETNGQYSSIKRVL